MINWDDISVDCFNGTWYAYDSKSGSLTTGDSNAEAFEALMKMIGE